MGYRTSPDDRHPFGHRPIIDLASNRTVLIDNGAISRISIECFYEIPEEPHRKWHDHIGWPSPDSLDDSCQAWVMDEHLIAIDLEDEGFNIVRVSLLNPPSGLSASGTIEENKVIIEFNAACPSAESDDVEVSFAIYIIGQATLDGRNLNDVLMKGTLRIIAGPIG